MPLIASEPIFNKPANVSVEYCGEIAGKRVIDVIEKYHLYVLPTLGENFGHSILEAMMSSTPLLISDKTPWRNLAEKGAGWDLPISDGDGFSQAIDKVASMDAHQLAQLCRTTHSAAKNIYDELVDRERLKRMFGC